LLSKLQFYGIRGTILKWFRSYLTDRKQKFEIKSPKYTQNFYSNWETIKHGVPQGSIMSNFFFACNLGTADEREYGGRWNQLLC
jgi:hypothetical protein